MRNQTRLALGASDECFDEGVCGEYLKAVGEFEGFLEGGEALKGLVQLAFFLLKAIKLLVNIQDGAPDVLPEF